MESNPVHGPIERVDGPHKRIRDLFIQLPADDRPPRQRVGNQKEQQRERQPEYTTRFLAFRVHPLILPQTAVRGERGGHRFRFRRGTWIQGEKG